MSGGCPDKKEIVPLTREKELHFKIGKSVYYLRDIFLGAGAIVFVVVVWHLLVRYGIIDNRLMPTPIKVVETFIAKLTQAKPDGAILIVNILSSFQVAFLGFLIAIAVVIALGLFMAWYKPVDRFVRPLFELIRPVSPIAWIPLMILLVGIGLKARLFIVFFAAFTPSVINSYTGIKVVPQPLLNVAKAFGATSWQMFTRVAIPSALPYIFGGIKISLTYSWAVLVAAEMLAANRGLGYMILQGRQFFKPDLIIVGMLTIGLIGILLIAGIEKLEDIVLKREKVD